VLPTCQGMRSAMPLCLCRLWARAEKANPLTSRACCCAHLPLRCHPGRYDLIPRRLGRQNTVGALRGGSRNARQTGGGLVHGVNRDGRHSTAWYAML